VNLSVTVAGNERQHTTIEGSGLNHLRGINVVTMMVYKTLAVENVLIKSQKRQVKHLWCCLSNQPLETTDYKNYDAHRDYFWFGAEPIDKYEKGFKLVQTHDLF